MSKSFELIDKEMSREIKTRKISLKDANEIVSIQENPYYRKGFRKSGFRWSWTILKEEMLYQSQEMFGLKPPLMIFLFRNT